MKREFHIFVYGSLRSDGPDASLLGQATLVGNADVPGTLYATEQGYPALVLGGSGRVSGEIWRCPVPLLWRLDEFEGVGVGLFRRVALSIDGIPCWTYVGGPRLSRQLTPERRLQRTS